MIYKVGDLLRPLSKSHVVINKSVHVTLDPEDICLVTNIYLSEFMYNHMDLFVYRLGNTAFQFCEDDPRFVKVWDDV